VDVVHHKAAPILTLALLCLQCHLALPLGSSADSQAPDQVSRDQAERDVGPPDRIASDRTTGADGAHDLWPDQWTADSAPGCVTGADCADDGLPCTDEQCASGVCLHVVIVGFCRIASACYPAGDGNPIDLCLRCDPGSSQVAWTKVPGGCVTTVAGGAAGFGDGPTATAQFKNPYDLAVSASGVVFVADTLNHRVREISGGQVSTLAGSGIPGFADGPAASAQLNRPAGVVIAGGIVHVADYVNQRIRSISGGQLTTLAGSGATGLIDGPAAAAQFGGPSDVAIDSAGTVYVADYSNHCIRAISGGQVTTFAGSKQGYFDGPVAAALFNQPSGLTVAPNGTIYVAEMGNHRVRAISGGQVSTLAGSGTASFADGPAASAMFNTPSDVTVDGAKVFVADSSNHRIRVISGGQVSTLAGSGTAGFADGPAASAQLNVPSGVSCGAGGKVYIADNNNHRIRLYTP